MRKTILILILATIFVAAGVIVYYGRAQQSGNAMTMPLEARQIILPDGHPEFPPNTLWVIVQDQQGPIEVPIPLTIPDHWRGKYDVLLDGNVAYFKYTQNSDMKETIFAIAAMTEAQWREFETEPTYYGETVLQYSGIVYLYNHALDNVYSGTQADEFANLVAESRSVANSLPEYFSSSLDHAEIPPIELQRIILPDGHPEFPSDTVWVVVPSKPAYCEVPIPLAIPAKWAGKYVIDHEDNVARYLYLVDPGEQETIFSITALTEADWQAIQNEPHGEALLSYGGIVWVYNPALENLYEGEQADEFSQMVGEAYDMAHSLAGFFKPQISRETTLPVLQAYFDSLGEGNYLAAAQMYAGDYSQLIEYNPDVSPSDGAAFFEAACTVNGFLCHLKIGEIVKVEQVSPMSIQFALRLQNPDGSPFELGPCCGADPATSPSQTEFIYTVASVDGLFKILELPVYVP